MRGFLKLASVVVLVLALSQAAGSSTYLARRNVIGQVPSWSDLMVSHYRFNEATNSDTAIDSSGNGNHLTECDANCDVNRDVDETDTVRDKWTSADFDANDWFECTEANCPVFNTLQDYTWGCGNKIGNTSSKNYVIGKGLDETGATGFSLVRLSTPHTWKCGANGATDTGAAGTDSQMYHSVCVADNTNDTLKLYLNGAEDTTNNTAMTGDLVDSSDEFLINSDASPAGVNMYTDDCFVAPQALQLTDICRIGSVGVTGELGECDSTNPTLWKGCGTNSDCNGGIGICDSAATAKDDTYCTADSTTNRCCSTGGAACQTSGDCAAGTCTANCAGCCMGYNELGTSTDMQGCALTPCNQAQFSPVPNVYPPSWLGSFVALYGLNNVNTDTSTGGGEQASLTAGGATFGTTAPLLEGTHYSTQSTNSSRNCSTSTGCTDNDADSGESLTVFCRLYPTSLGDDYAVNAIGTVGYRMVLRTAGNTQCYANAVTTQTSTTVAANIWRFSACRYDNPNNLIYPAHLSGASTVTYGSGAAWTGTGDWTTADNPTFRLGTTTTGTNHQGRHDECGIAKKLLTDAQLCRVCSLTAAGGTAGKGECESVSGREAFYKPCDSNTDCVGGTGVCALTHDTDAYCDNEAAGRAGCCMGWNDTHCGSCDMAACNAAAP